MKAANIHVGDTYAIRIGGKPAEVRIMRALPSGQFHAVNQRTGRVLVLRSARRLRYNVTLFNQVKAYYADIAAGNDPGPAGSAVMEGDFEGIEVECQRLHDAARKTAAARALAAQTKQETPCQTTST